MREKTWFLDQEIAASGFVRIQDSSLTWEERVDETRIITTVCLTACLDKDGQSLAEKRKERWEGHDQALISTTGKETKSEERQKKL